MNKAGSMTEDRLDELISTVCEWRASDELINPCDADLRDIKEALITLRTLKEEEA